MAQPPKKPRPTNPKFTGRPVKQPSMPQPKNLTPPNATGIKTTKPKPKKQVAKRVGIGTGKNGMYW